MFYYKTSFLIKAVFLEKTVKNPFVEEHCRFEGWKASGDKNQYNFFIGIDVLNVFHLTILKKKKQYFSK